MINDIFRDMLNEGWLIIYMDDILIYSNDPEEHRKRTLHVLARLRKNDLFLKAEKCKFDIKEVEYLGLIISKNKIAMDLMKLAGIRNWPAPRNVKGVQSFLGFGNFYQRFIGHFAEIARPLNALTKKDQPFEWTTECQKAFDALYESLTKLRLILQTGICQKKFSVTDFIRLFFPRSVSTVQPLQKLLTLLTVGLKISRDADFE
jgi:hypothetical protein